MQSVRLPLFTAGVIICVWLVGSWVSAFVFAHCDKKFGCWGGVQFAFFMSLLASGLSALATAVVEHLLANLLPPRSARLQTLVAVAMGASLSALLWTVGRWPFDLPATLLAWFGLSAIVAASTITVASNVSNTAA